LILILNKLIITIIFKETTRTKYTNNYNLYSNWYSKKMLFQILKARKFY